MKCKLFLFSICFLISWIVTGQLSAQVPEMINYQAKLTDPATHAPVADGSYTVTFSIYDVATGGTALWTETQNVQTTGGIYSVLLGSLNPVDATLFSGEERYLGVVVGSDPEMTPRKQMVSVPYAFQAKKAETVANETDPAYIASPAASLTTGDITHLDNLSGINTGDQDLSGFITAETDPKWSGSANQIGNIGRTGSVGIGISSPTALLHAEGSGTGGGNVLFSGLKKDLPGDPPASGNGTRMMWYPDKAAFRAGDLSKAHWDKDSIGTCSVAMGYDTKAKTIYSTAMGCNSTASGFTSTALGYSTIASGHASTAMGHSTAATGAQSTAMGIMALASGGRSTAMGYWTTASGYASTAMGTLAKGTGMYSFAINLSSTSGPDIGDNIFRISGANEIGGNVAWTNYSDRRLKKDIQSLGKENNLDRIMQLNGVRFRWKDNDTRLNIGFLAQEVKDIIPESVHYDELNDIYSMEYTAIIPVLVEGIKEQQKVIESLQLQNEKQQSEIRSLQQQINEMQK